MEAPKQNQVLNKQGMMKNILAHSSENQYILKADWLPRSINVIRSHSCELRERRNATEIRGSLEAMHTALQSVS